MNARWPVSTGPRCVQVPGAGKGRAASGRSPLGGGRTARELEASRGLEGSGRLGEDESVPRRPLLGELGARRRAVHDRRARARADGAVGGIVVRVVVMMMVPVAARSVGRAGCPHPGTGGSRLGAGDAVASLEELRDGVHRGDERRCEDVGEEDEGCRAPERSLRERGGEREQVSARVRRPHEAWKRSGPATLRQPGKNTTMIPIPTRIQPVRAISFRSSQGNLSRSRPTIVIQVATIMAITVATLAATASARA